MKNNDCLIHLQMLSAKYPYTAFDSDITSLSLIQLWCVYRYLSRLAQS